MTRYQKNVKCLQQFHPELETLLSQDISTSHITVEKSESGAPRLLVQLESGQVAYVHNAKNPAAVAKKMAAELNANQGGLLVMMEMSSAISPRT